MERLSQLERRDLIAALHEAIELADKWLEVELIPYEMGGVGVAPMVRRTKAQRERWMDLGVKLQKRQR